MRGIAATQEGRSGVGDPSFTSPGKTHLHATIQL